MGRSGMGVRMDVNEELKFSRENQKKNIFFFFGGCRFGGQSGCEQ